MSLAEPARYPDPGADPEPRCRVRTARPKDLEQITGVLTSSAEPLAATSYLVPEVRKRPEVLTPYFRLFAEYVVYEPAAAAQVAVDEWGTVDAVALWLDGEDPGPPAYANQRATIAGPWADRFAQLDSLLATSTPAMPHERLVLLGTRPGRQRHGLGSALLAARHADLDGLRTATHAIASCAEATRLYERNGYRRLGPPLLLPNGADLHPYVRTPR